MMGINKPQVGTLQAAEEGSRKSFNGQRLLFVTPRYAPLLGGVESHVEQVARRAAASGLEVHVLTTNPGDLPAKETRDGVHIQRVRYWPSGSDLYFSPDIYRRIRSGDWDLVHLQSYHTLVAPLAMLAALRAGIPYVVTFHGGGHSSRLRHSIRGVQHWLLKPLLRRAERLIALAQFEIPFFSSRLGIPPEKFVLIPNGADLPQIDPPPPRQDGTTLITSIGRLERYKGHQRILAAMPYILQKRPAARLWIAGSGPYEEDLHRQIEQLGLSDCAEIRAVPPSQRQRLARELAGSDLVVLLSEYETHPIAILEALSLGRPALVADTSGLSELSQKGWARAVPLDASPQEVAQAALTQLEQPILPEALDLYTWDRCTQDLLALYGTIWRGD